jgi:cytochrome b561
MLSHSEFGKHPFAQFNVSKLPGTGIEHGLASVGHFALYAFMTIMPASGIAMGYYGGEIIAIEY